MRRRRCRLRRAFAGGRRDTCRQNNHRRNGIRPPRTYKQPLESCAYAWRIFQRIGCSRGMRDGSGGAWNPDRRLDHPPRRVLWDSRIQANLRPCAHERHHKREPAPGHVGLVYDKCDAGRSYFPGAASAPASASRRQDGCVAGSTRGCITREARCRDSERHGHGMPHLEKERRRRFVPEHGRRMEHADHRA